MRYHIMETEQRKKTGSVLKQNNQATAPIQRSTSSQLQMDMMATQAGFGNCYVQRMVDHLKTGQDYSDTVQTTQPGLKDSAHENRTGLPDQLKLGVEQLSGYSLDEVRVHYNSSKPAELQALAFTQDTDIYVAPGQERHLPHEAWHVVQQKQGRVKPTMQLQEKNVNDDLGLEQEADRAADVATRASDSLVQRQLCKDNLPQNTPVLQCRDGLEEQLDIEGRDFLALLKAQFDENIHDIIDEAWEDIAEGIRCMREGQQENGKFFFDLAAKRLAVIMPQPEQVGPHGLALWSGNGARAFAQGHGYTVLEDSAIGGVLSVLSLGAILPEWSLMRPLWDAISRQYASLPKSGEVHIFAVARQNIEEILQSPPEEKPVLLSTEINVLAEKSKLLQSLQRGGGITEVWHILVNAEGNNLRSINIRGELDDQATFGNLGEAVEAMRQYYHYPQPPGAWE